MDNPSLLKFLVDIRGEESTSIQLRDDLMTMLIAGTCLIKILLFPFILHTCLQISRAHGCDLSNTCMHSFQCNLMLSYYVTTLGHETTAAVLTWALFEMAQKPHVIKKAQEELDRVLVLCALMLIAATTTTTIIATAITTSSIIIIIIIIIIL